ncbi:hypothetical protein SERLADRAFT_381211 [Serpula lacrymans var. lacrymans S7.9]|uniref:Uncharacterized protein n=1 Tax=Serpula lacrymans var. lacrymans (strain S7.9) TaxID=578457 RepID=F8NNL2_SERL9|nr:uncharacterized protein SERLADRAFT_381211 [Serpula lacrymans var. lacrymans S7.9]EGO27054.1 hypothetical protein SERLADRAFT_381211 [Serpula lacrymans var. lacrymans S7.9]
METDCSCITRSGLCGSSAYSRGIPKAHQILHDLERSHRSELGNPEVPDHVLDYDPHSFSDKNEISKAMDDHTPLALLNHVRQNSGRWKQASISVGEDVDV